MSDNSHRYIARSPRHQAAINTDLDVEIHREKGFVPDVMQGELINLSRRGLGIRVPVPMLLEELLTIRLRHAKSNLDLELTASVCRIVLEKDGMWFIGCHTTHPLPPEVLGELFLNQILSIER